MCGIVGKISAGSGVSTELITRMNGCAVHRGPDDSGVFVDGNIGFGHRRLSILDPSPAGHQPMATGDRRYWIVYNGEIYNFWDIRSELEHSGYKFETRTDTETVLAAYREWGPSCLKRFNGMFAMAIWDTQERMLFLARDRMGIKPLYYSSDGTSVVFASEMKAIVSDPSVKRELSPVAVRNFFSFGHSVAPDTIFSNVKKLMPGHHMMCRDRGNGVLEVRTEQYWAVPEPNAGKDEGEEYYVAKTREMLEDSVRRRMLADVPVGAFLSGGIDSSAVVGLMQSMSPTPVRTFTVGFKSDDTGYNELDAARSTSDHFGTDHTELMVGHEDVVDAMDRLAFHYDEPYADAASLPTLLVSKLAKSRVQVVLSGEGADEIFGGYRRYLAEKYMARIGWMTSMFSSSLARRVLRMSAGSSRSKRLLRGIGYGDPVRRYAGWFQVFSDEAQEQMLAPSLVNQMDGVDSTDVYRRVFLPGNGDVVNSLLYVDQKTWLPDTYLEKLDKATMAVGLEGRVPFLDHELVEFAATIPAKYKIKGRRTKHILKESVKDLLRPETLSKSKHGFAVPYPVWFRGPLRDFVADTLLGQTARSRGLFNLQVVEQMIEKQRLGQETHYRQLWLLMAFELWARRFMDGGAEPVESSEPSVLVSATS